MRTLSFAATAAIALLSAAPVLAETRVVDLRGFTAIDISSGIDAVVSIGPTQAVEAEAADPRLLDDLELKVEGSTLKAYYDWSLLDIFSFGRDRQIKLRITVPALHAIAASAGSDVEAKGIVGEGLEFNASSGADISVTGVVAKSIDLEASSGARIEVSGTCDSARANASSGSDLDASELVCSTVDANASSGSDLEVHATSSVTINASSGSDVTVTGKPGSVKQESSSGADIRID